MSLSVITEVGSIAGRVKHAENAVAAGVDFVVAQGSEAGGHTGQVNVAMTPFLCRVSLRHHLLTAMMQMAGGYYGSPAPGAGITAGFHLVQGSRNTFMMCVQSQTGLQAYNPHTHPAVRASKDAAA